MPELDSGQQEAGDRQRNPNDMQPERQAALMARAPIIQPGWAFTRHDHEWYLSATVR
jgi:hypothetical protein